MKRVSLRSNGSVILIIMIIMTFLTGCFITTLLATHKLCSLAQARLVYQQQRSLLEGLGQVGIAYCCDHRVDLFTPNRQPRIMYLSFDPWPAPELVNRIGHYKGSVEIQQLEKGVEIKTELSDGKIHRTGSCLITLWDRKKAVAKNSKLHVNNWTIDG